MNVYDWPVARYRGAVMHCLIWEDWDALHALIQARKTPPIVSKTKEVIHDCPF